MPLAEAA
jgi:poly [ADP-ribose] polymerase